MGQCVSRNSMAPYAGVHPYDASSIAELTLPVAVYDDYYYVSTIHY